MTVVDCRMSNKRFHCAIHHQNIHKKSVSSILFGAKQKTKALVFIVTAKIHTDK